MHFSQEWQTIDLANYSVTVNGHKATTEEADRGPYNVFLRGCPYYDVTKYTRDEARDLFMTALSEGFAFEVMEVISGNFKHVI